MLATLLQLIGLGVILAWLYVQTRSVPLTALLHNAQTFFGIVNHGLDPVQQSWLMAAVYVSVAAAVTLLAGPSFMRRDAAAAGVMPAPAEASG
jgi:hypothetical protein